MSARMKAAVAVLVMAAAACDSTTPAEPHPQPGPEPQPLAGSWSVTHVRGVAMPGAVLYVFDPATVNGRESSVHVLVDSSRLVITADGRYQHRTWATEWVGEVGGPPVAPWARWFHGDFGVWTRAGNALEFESGWLQNHTMTGTYADDGILRMQHGFSHGDTPVAFRYGRTAAPPGVPGGAQD